jgi:phospho-N-acetylmuramoyl-pentapeptide-transferase
LGFLWFNAHPAQVFMGEIGSQALAVGLVVVAFMTGWWLLLPVIGCVFVIEGASDVIQIAYFKATHGRRVFRMAPIHYHFQLSGWTETQVVTRFWLIGLVGAFSGLALAWVN